MSVLCPFCNSSDVVGKFYKDFDKSFSISQKDKYLMHLCSNCGLLFAYPKPSHHELKVFYRNEYHNARHTITPRTKTHWHPILNLLKHDNIFANTAAKAISGFYDSMWMEIISEAIGKLHKKNEIVQILQKHKRSSLLHKPTLLEVGCGDGGNLANFTLHGYNAIGLEPSKDMVESLNGAGATVINGYIESFKYADMFDIVTCIGTLCSVDSVKETIDSISNLLNEGGLFVVKEGNPYCSTNLKGACYFYEYMPSFFNGLDGFKLEAIYGLDGSNATLTREISLAISKDIPQLVYVMSKL